jgi:hypothetical protein
VPCAPVKGCTLTSRRPLLVSKPSASATPSHSLACDARGTRVACVTDATHGWSVEVQREQQGSPRTRRRRLPPAQPCLSPSATHLRVCVVGALEPGIIRGRALLTQPCNQRHQAVTDLATWCRAAGVCVCDAVCWKASQAHSSAVRTPPGVAAPSAEHRHPAPHLSEDRIEAR